MKIRLLTMAGEFVHEATIAPFLVVPEIILWGTRVFVVRGSVTLPDEVQGDGSFVWNYYEGVLYPLIDGLTGR